MFLQFNYVKNVPEEIKCCKPSNHLLAYHLNIIRENPLKMYVKESIHQVKDEKYHN